MVLAVLLAASCQRLEPRRPIQAHTGSWIEGSVKRNMALLQKEEAQIQQIIAKDTLAPYQMSEDGFWYRISVANPKEQYRPQPEDIVKIEYTMYTLEGKSIYAPIQHSYKVDKEQLFPGLRAGVKLLKAGETGEFLLPSFMGYGYHGDEKKIGSNTPIKLRLTIFEVLKHQ